MTRSVPAWAKLALSVAAVTGTVAGGLAAAGAATSSPAPAFGGSPVTACVNGNAKPYHTVPWRGLWQVYTNNPSKPDCPRGAWKASFASESQLSHAERVITHNAGGVAGNAQAITKLQAVAGTTSALLQDPAKTPASITTGGSFVANATSIGTLKLAAGTYLVNFNAKATPNTDTAAVQVFPQFFVYNQPKNPGFAGDLFNVGAGALEPDATKHDSYYSGSDVVTVPAGGETLNVYAFGYDSDRGGATYALDSATITAVRLAG